jgi:DNA ligase-1
MISAAMAEPPAAAPGLTLREVNDTFERFAAVAGRGSAAEKAALLARLFQKATRNEQEFLVRLVLGELRQGALAGIMVDGIATASGVSAEEVRRALMLAGDLPVVAVAALTEGSAGLRRFSMRLFQPVLPMLAQTAEDVEDAVKRLEEPVFEWKLDGARIQVHKAGSDVRVFTRKLNDVSAAVPEIIEAVGNLPAREIILDGETLAFRPDGMPHPFQTTMRRFGRKLDVARLRELLPLQAYFFDCLYLDGESLIDRTERERQESLIHTVPADISIPRLVTGDAAAAEAFLKEAIQKGHEGLMAKSLDSLYEAGRRGAGWLKVKPAVTLDLVVLAAEWGHGRRHGWLSNLHLGARDPETGGFVMLGKTFKGMSDEMLAWQTKRFLELEVARDAWTVYVKPEVVVEVAFNEIQESPRYEGGLALRFARVKRYRPDKSAAEADVIGTVRALFARRSGKPIVQT